MRKKFRFSPVGAGLLAFVLAAPAWAHNSNKSISIGAGQTASSASTVNGSIKVGEDAVITGSVETVNGSIRIGDNAQLEDVETVNGSLRIGDGVKTNDVSSVNGSITLGASVTVRGEVSTVNGRITVAQGSTISEDVSNINGEIKLSGAEVSGDLSTVNGDVLLLDAAVLQGNLTVERPQNQGKRWRDHLSKVIIGPGARVAGDIILEQKVELYISETARVGEVRGVMSIADAIRFSGDRP